MVDALAAMVHPVVIVRKDPRALMLSLVLPLQVPHAKF